MSNEYEDSLPQDNSRSRQISAASSVARRGVAVGDAQSLSYDSAKLRELEDLLEVCRRPSPLRIPRRFGLSDHT